MNKIKRRDFLIGTSGMLLLGCSEKESKLPLGQLLGPDANIGHKLRDGKFPKPVREERTNIIIAGAGISGLSCGWWLQRNNVDDFSILELESVTGGNARSGRNAVSAFPWGAHYLPLPGTDAVYVRELLAELGVLHGDMLAEAPEYDEKMLVQAPDERLYINGAWQEGLVPHVGIGAQAQSEIARFENLMVEWSRLRGRDGRFVFTIPSACGSNDPEFLALDNMTFAEWLQKNYFKCEPLDWYVGYSLRDDFGADHHRVSAWAGLHYFCCRRGLAKNADTHSVITSPQGNGWIVDRLTAKLSRQLRTGHTVVAIEDNKNNISLDVYDSATQEVVRIYCEQLVWAAPIFMLPKIWRNMPIISVPDYAPWLVANITLTDVNESEFNTWDNVIYQGEGLGYVDATHQTLQYHRPNRVLSYYNALSDMDTLQGRRQLWERSHEHWTRTIFADLSKAHPDLQKKCSAVDIWRWPHAMAIPVPGFLSALKSRRLQHERIHIAHSDLSGFSLFEEANYWGVQAAKRILKATN